MSSVEDDPLAKGYILPKPLLITIWVLFGVSTILLACRLAIRLHLHHRVFWDDGLAILGLLFLLAENILIVLILPHVFMLVWYLDDKIARPDNFDEQIAKMLKLSFAINILFASSLWSVKASFMALMWRLVKNLKIFRKVWWVIVGILAVTYCVMVALEPIACAKLYNNGCVSESDVYRNLVTLRLGTAIDIFTDVLIMGLPVGFTLKSKLPRAQKLGLIGLFTLGFIIIGTAVVRIISLNNEDRHPSLSWKVFWGSIENSVAIMTSCFASFKSLLTLRRRPSLYPYAGGRDVYETANHRSQRSQHLNSASNHASHHDLDVPLVSRQNNKHGDNKRSRLKESHVNGSHRDGGDGSWGDGESREEILHGTEFDTRSTNGGN